MSSTLKGQIEADLKTALLGGNKLNVEVLRGLKSVILYQEVADNKRDGNGLSDNEIEQLLAKEAKKRDESAGLFEKGGNKASANKERQEKVIIQKYLPKELGEDELSRIIDEVIAATSAVGPQAIGQVMGAVRAKVGTRGEGGMIARLVKTKLRI